MGAAVVRRRRRRPDDLHRFVDRTTIRGIATTAPHRVEDRFLYEIISTVASSLNLEEVLDAVVRLLSDASAVHACFVYLLERDEKRLVLRAARGWAGGSWPRSRIRRESAG